MGDSTNYHLSKVCSKTTQQNTHETICPYDIQNVKVQGLNFIQILFHESNNHSDKANTGQHDTKEELVTLKVYHVVRDETRLRHK